MTWTCKVCALDFPEPFCTFCGANLMPVKPPVVRPVLIAAGKEN